MSEDGESVAGLVPKIQAAFDKYTDGAVSIIDKQNGGLNDTYAILKQLSTVYPTLSEESRAYLNEAVAGNRQNKVLVAIMNNWKNVESAVQSATESTGSANRENEKYLDSINGKISQFQSQVQLLWKNTINSELIKFIVELGTAMVKLVDTIGMLPVAISLGMGALMLFSKGFQTFAISIIPAVLTKLGLVVAVENGVAIAATGAAISVKALSMAFLTLTPLLVAGAIYGVAKAYDYFTISVKEASEAINDGFNKSKDNINTLKALANEYETLAKKEIKSVDDKERLLEIQMQVNSQYLYGQKNIDLYTTAIDGNTTAIDENVKAIKEKARAEAEEFIKLHQAEYNISKRFLEEAYVVPNVGQFENAEEALVSLSKAMDNASLTGNEFLYNQIKKTYDLLLSEVTTANEAVVKFEGSQDLLKKAFDDTSDSAEKAAMAVYDYAKGLDEINGVIASVQSSLKDVNSLIEDNGTLTVDQVLNALQSYPELIDKITLTTDGYQIQESALIDLRAQQIKTVEDSIQLQIDEANNVKTQTAKKLEAYGFEIDKLKDVAKAKAEIAKLGDLEARKYAEGQTGGASDAGIRNGLFTEAYNDYLTKNGYAELSAYEQVIKDIEKLNKEKGTYTNLLNNIGTGDGGSKSKYEPSTKQQALKSLLDADKISLQKYYDELLLLEKSNYAGYEKKSVQQLESELRSTNETIAKKAEEYLSLKVEQSSIADQIQKALTDELSISFASTEKSLKSLDNELSKLGNIDTVEEQSKQSDIWTSKLKLVNDELLRIDKTLKETSGLSSAQIELLNDKKTELEILRASLTDSLAESSQNKLDAIEAVESKIIEIVKKRYEEEAKEREKEYNKEKEDLQDSLDNYKEYIQGRIDAIDKLSDAEDYNKNVQEQSEKISDIQSEIDKYSLAANSGDMDAQNRVKELLEEQADEQTNLTEMQTDRERELRKEALQDNLTNYEKYIDKQENLLDEEYDDYKENLEKITSDASLYAEAQSIMANSTFEELTNLYTTFENNFGSGMSLLGSIIEDEFIAKLKMAKSSLSDLNSLVGGKLTDSTDVELEKAKERIGKLQTMWYATNDPALHTKYYEEAEALRKKYKLRYQDLRGYKASYSTGGIDAVGGLNLLHGKENAVETIFNATQGKKLFDFVNNLPQSILNVVKPNIPSFTPLSSSGAMVNNFAFNVNGNVDKSVASDIVEQVIRRQRIEFNKMGFFK